MSAAQNTYPEYDLAMDTFYRIIRKEVDGRKVYEREYAPEGYKPYTPDELAIRSRQVLEFSAIAKPLMRQRRFRPLAWALGLHRARRA